MEQADTATHMGPRDRLVGYLAPLAEAGIDVSQVPIYETRNDRPTTVAALEHFFSDPAPPTAILAMSDKVALFALDWLRARDISVPGDVSIVGFDGVPDGEVSKPPLTSVRQPMAEMGRRAAGAILEFDGTVHREIMPLELVVRGSTAPPKGNGSR
jgi:DNA-binding LacI/PurR family transcriptional regulator